MSRGGEDHRKCESAVLTIMCLWGSLLWALLFLPSAHTLRAIPEGPSGAEPCPAPQCVPKTHTDCSVQHGHWGQSAPPHVPKAKIPGEEEAWGSRQRR